MNPEVTKYGYHVMSANILDSIECNKVIDFIESIAKKEMDNDNNKKG